MSLTSRRRRKAEINIVPLIDVLTMLIFFFLVSMQFREVATLNLTLPTVETAGRSEFQGPVIIAIDRDGLMTVNGQPASMQQLEVILDTVRSVDRDVTVLLRADENTALRRITSVMDACRSRGLNRIRLQSR